MQTKGRLSERQFPRLLMDIAHEGGTGVLTVRAGGARRQFAFANGELASVHCPPNAPQAPMEAEAELEAVARAMDGGFDWAPGEVKPVGTPMPLPPLATRVLLDWTPIELVGREIYALNAAYRFELSNAARLAGVTSSELGALKAIDSPQPASRILEQLGNTERSRRLLVAASVVEALTSKAAGAAGPPPAQPGPSPARPRVETIPQTAPRVEKIPQTRPRVEPIPTTRTPPAPPPTTQPSGGSASTDAAATDEKLPRDNLTEYVLKKHRSLSQSNHYQVLEVRRDASAEEIEANYLRFLKRYHPDSYFGDMDQETTQALEDIFGRLNEAYATLKSTESRKDYNQALDEGTASSGQVTEEDLILSRTQLEEGKRLYQQGDWRKARSILESARRLNPDSIEAMAFLGRTYLEGGTANRMPDKGFELLDRALDAEPERAIFHAFLGDYYRVTEDYAKAVRWYTQALNLDPEVPDVETLIAMCKSKAGSSKTSDGGLLGGLFRRKG